MNEYERDYSKINSENFTQKDLMQYLLHSTQHVATREELQGIKSDLRSEMKDFRIDLKTDSHKIDSKIDRLQWFLIAGFLTTLLKDYIF